MNLDLFLRVEAEEGKAAKSFNADKKSFPGCASLSWV